MDLVVKKPSTMIRDYLFSDVVGYDNMEKIRPEFVLDCQNKIYNKILILKYNNYEVYKKIISFLYLEYLNLQEIESKFSESASYLYLKNENVDLNFILELVDIEDNFLYELIRSTITIYVLNKKHVKMSFNEKLEEKWNPYYEMEKIAYNFEHNDYEVFKNILYEIFNKKGISAVLTEIDIIKKKRPEFYNKLIMDILKNFFIYDFVICQNNSLLNQLKYAIIEGKDLIKFYENLNFVSRLTLLVVSFQFSFRYNELNMYIRNTFAEEKEYAKPFIEALTL